MCIDPQQQALNWIKKKEEKNKLKVQKVMLRICNNKLHVYNTKLTEFTRCFDKQAKAGNSERQYNKINTQQL